MEEYKGPSEINFVRIQERAQAAVYKAVLNGSLINLKETYTACLDCGNRAMVYDHRDYRRPLDVDPVCVGCNTARGPADGHDVVKAKEQYRLRRAQRAMRYLNKGIEDPYS